MRHDAHLTTLAWADYELLDSGDNEKLERFGDIILARPETQAIWSKAKPELWETAHARFTTREGGKGAWEMKTPVPESWPISWRGATASAKLTSFKHTGIFPEQEPNWTWLSDHLQALGSDSTVLNLFGYTGIASLVAAKAGARVTHVDASKQSLDWAHDNARLSNIDEEAIRWIPDDALAFAKRELRRGARYHGIILDPPAFGRGAKGEVWRIEDDLLTLLNALKGILAEEPGAFFLLNGYAAGYAARSFAQAVEGVFGPIEGESGELHIAESGTDRVVPAGIYVRFVR